MMAGFDTSISAEDATGALNADIGSIGFETHLKEAMKAPTSLKPKA